MAAVKGPQAEDGRPEDRVSFFFKAQRRRGKEREEQEMEGKKKRSWGEGGFYYFQLVPGAVVVAWRPAVFRAAQSL